MQFFLQKIYFLLFLLAGYCSTAQVKFTATVSPAEIGKDEYTQLKLKVENAREVQQILPPSLSKDFIILSGPNQESGMTMINGVVNKFIALNFIIKPKATGRFSIPGALAMADGGQYKSNSVILKVTAKSTGNSGLQNATGSPFAGNNPFAEPVPRSSYNDFILRKGENPSDKIGRNMFVRVVTDKKTCYVGEPVVATYKLYTRMQSESNMIKNPSFNGFSVLDMQQPNNMSYQTEKFEGREYNVYNLRKVQLYPLLSGELELGIIEIENNVRFIKAEYINQQADAFGNIFRDFTNGAVPAEGMEQQKVTLRSKPMAILVKPMPEENKPADFKGAVGLFKIEAMVEKNNFSTNDAGRFALVISGEGNMQMINAPAINWPEGVEGFDSKATDDLFLGTVPVSGRKIFEFPFTVLKPGTYTIPAVTLNYFDNHDAKYKSIATTPLKITVTQGTGKPQTPVTSSNNKANGNFLTKFFNNRLRVVSLLAVLMIVGLIVWLKRDTKKEKQIAAEASITVAVAEPEDEQEPEILLTQQNPLALANECMQQGDTALFYAELNLGMKNYLSHKLNIPAEAFNRKAITEQLGEQGISNDTAMQLQQLLNEIEWQLYTPFADHEKMKEMYERANGLIQLMNTYRA